MPRRNSTAQPQSGKKTYTYRPLAAMREMMQAAKPGRPSRGYSVKGKYDSQQQRFRSEPNPSLTRNVN
jgi:hypothetical protein